MVASHLPVVRWRSSFQRALATVIVKSSTLVSVIEPIEILTAMAAVYIAFVFLVSACGKFMADRLRVRYGLAVS